MNNASSNRRLVFYLIIEKLLVFFNFKYLKKLVLFFFSNQTRHSYSKFPRFYPGQHRIIMLTSVGQISSSGISVYLPFSNNQNKFEWLERKSNFKIKKRPENCHICTSVQFFGSNFYF